MISTFERETLYLRHHLSHEQIDDVLGEGRSGQYPESKAQHLNKVRAFLKVSELFNKNAVEFLPLKGPLLSYRLYNDPLYRVYSDLDFFVASGAVSVALEILRRNGFKTIRYELPDDECRRKLLFRHVSEIHLYHSEWDALVELHWNIFNVPIIMMEVHNRLLRENVTRCQYEGINFSILSKEFEILYLIIHAGFHGWSRLKWLLDIKVFLEKFPVDEIGFVLLCKRLNAQRQVSVCNELLGMYFPGSIHLPYSEKISGRLIKLAIRNINMVDEKESIGKYLSNFLISWRVFPSFKYRVNLLKQRFFATDLITVKWIPCLSVFYYILSPFWKLFRGFRE